MTSTKSVKNAPAIVLDPNFFLPPNVVDMRYRTAEEENDSAVGRSDSGEIVNVEYDDSGFSELQEGVDENDENDSVSSFLSPPDYANVVSQTVRVTADGKFVVDVILDVEDVPGAVQYDVRITKP
jgi:hypothetical protein